MSAPCGCTAFETSDSCDGFEIGPCEAHRSAWRALIADGFAAIEDRVPEPAMLPLFEELRRRRGIDADLRRLLEHFREACDPDQRSHDAMGVELDRVMKALWPEAKR